MEDCAVHSYPSARPSRAVKYNLSSPNLWNIVHIEIWVVGLIFGAPCLRGIEFHGREPQVADVTKGTLELCPQVGPILIKFYLIEASIPCFCEYLARIDFAFSTYACQSSIDNVEQAIISGPSTQHCHTSRDDPVYDWALSYVGGQSIIFLFVLREIISKSGTP